MTAGSTPFEGNDSLAVPAANATRIALLAFGTCLALGGTAIGGKAGIAGALAAIALAMVAATGSRLLAWRVLALFVLGVALFVPARVVLAVHLPIDAEPYRLAAAGVFLVWLVALLSDPAVQLRRTRFDRPLGLLFVAILLSELSNPHLVDAYGHNVVKALMLFFSFLLLYYFVSSVFTSRRDVDVLVKALVAGAAVVAFTALVERAFKYDVYSLLGRFPGFNYDATAGTERAGEVRVRASAEHPIALGAVLAIIVPLSIYLARRSRLWLVATLLLVTGVIVTVSRTPVVMLVASGLVFVVLRPRVIRLAPLIPVVLIAAYLAAPGSVSASIRAFFPHGGLLAEQSTSLGQGGSNTRGRLSDLGPALGNVAQRPFFGSGQGTRVYNPNSSAAYLPDGRYGGILDDQWLGSLIDIGVLGVTALLWLFVSGYRALAKEARLRDDDDGWLASALAASVVSFPVGMLFFDTFAFMQVVIIFFFLLGVASVFLYVLEPVEERVAELVPEPRRRRVVTQLGRVFDYGVDRAPNVDQT